MFCVLRKRIVKQFASQPKMAEENDRWVFFNCLLHMKLFCNVGCINMESKSERETSTVLPFVFPLYVLKVFPFLASPVHGVAKSQTRLSDFTFTFHFHALEKEMATHSSVLAWRIPGTGEPGGPPSMGSHRVGHN